MEARRRWQYAVEHWMTNSYQMKKIDAIHQHFHKRGGGEDLVLLFTKFVGDFYIAGTASKADHFFMLWIFHNRKS